MVAFSDPLLTAFLLVETTRGGEPVWAVKWRSASGVRRKRRLGELAWMELSSGGWRPRAGRSRPGYLTERQARRLIPSVIEAAAEEASAPAPAAPAATFRDLTGAWLRHLDSVTDVKPSTLRSYRSLLAEPGTPHKRGNGVARGWIMGALGDKSPSEIATADVVELLDRIHAHGVSRRTVNRYREIVVAILNFGLRPEQKARWNLAANPAAAAPKRRVDEPARLEVFTVEQIEALARSAETGAWRTERPYETPNARDASIFEDQLFGDLLRVAAYTGLRRGELVALRWRDVRWSERVLVVERALSDTVERSTKGRRVRYVPLGDQALTALERVSQRQHFLGEETTSSARSPATDSTRRRSGDASSPRATQLLSHRCASTTSATQRARSSRACSIP